MGAEGAAQDGSIIENLRDRIRRLEAAPRPSTATLLTGVQPFDALLGGGLPLGTTVEFCGPEASGRTSLALRALATATSHSKLAAYVDSAGQLYGPAVAAMGVALPSLLVVRPESPLQSVWAAVQLVRSGAMACVVLDLTGTGHRLTPPESQRLSSAASHSGGLLLLLTSPERPGEGGLRLSTQALGVEGFQVELLRSRHTGWGRTIIAWEALAPHPALWRHRIPQAVKQLQALPPRIRRGVREALSLHRTGPVGVYGQRPGRDLSMPLLEDIHRMGG